MVVSARCGGENLARYHSYVATHDTWEHPLIFDDQISLLYGLLSAAGTWPLSPGFVGGRVYPAAIQTSWDGWIDEWKEEEGSDTW